MATPGGFHYVSGQRRIIFSAVSSTATFKAFNPVTYAALGRTLIEAESDSTAIVGVALADAGSTLGGTNTGKVPVLVPMDDTVFITKIATSGVAASLLSAGQAYTLEKSGNYLRPDTDSAATPHVVCVPRGDGSTIDSNDSTIYVQFLQDRIGPMNSNASFVIFGN